MYNINTINIFKKSPIFKQDRITYMSHSAYYNTSNYTQVLLGPCAAGTNIMELKGAFQLLNKVICHFVQLGIRHKQP